MQCAIENFSKVTETAAWDSSCTKMISQVTDNSTKYPLQIHVLFNLKDEKNINGGGLFYSQIILSLTNRRIVLHKKSGNSNMRSFFASRIKKLKLSPIFVRPIKINKDSIKINKTVVTASKLVKQIQRVRLSLLRPRTS